MLIKILLLWSMAASAIPVALPKIEKGEFAVFDGKKYRKFTVFDYEDMKISSDCKAKNMKCKAFIATTKKIDKNRTPEPNISPASQICRQVDGINLIAIDSKKDEYNYCQFDDGSLINSWSLFYRFFPKNIVK